MIQIQFVIKVRINKNIYNVISYKSRSVVLLTYVKCKNVTDVNETTIYYNITGLCHSLSYTFIVQVMDIFNNMKNKNHIGFCKLIICWFIYLIVFDNLFPQHYSNLPCSRTLSTVLL